MTDSITVLQMVETNEHINGVLVAAGDAYTSPTCGSVAMIDDMISKLVTIKTSLKTVSAQISRNLGTAAVQAILSPTVDAGDAASLDDGLVVCTVRDSSEVNRQSDNATIAKCVGVYTGKTVASVYNEETVFLGLKGAGDRIRTIFNGTEDFAAIAAIDNN